MENYLKSNLVVIREKRKLSQNALALLLNVNQSNIVRWESGERAPSIDNVVNISNILNIPLDILVGIDLRIEENVILDDNHKLDIMIQDKSKDLTENGKKALINIIDNLSSIDNK